MTTLDTVTVQCSCRHCAAYATEQGLRLPLFAIVNTKMYTAICTNARGIHSMVQKAHQPPFGRMDAMQTEMGPWKA